MSAFHDVELVHDGLIVLMRRGSRPFENASELDEERERLCSEFDAIGRIGRALLIDARSAPVSTDEKLHEPFSRFRLEVARGFSCVATLVRTKVGMLQVSRLAAAQQISVRPFDDEGAAISYLLNELGAELRGS